MPTTNFLQNQTQLLLNLREKPHRTVFLKAGSIIDLPVDAEYIYRGKKPTIHRLDEKIRQLRLNGYTVMACTINNELTFFITPNDEILETIDHWINIMLQHKGEI